MGRVPEAVAVGGNLLPDERVSRKPDESLNEYAVRLFALGDTQRVRIHPDYIDGQGNVLVRPVASVAFDADGTPHPLVGTGGQQPTLMDEDHAFVSVAATAAAQAIVQPASPKIFYLYAIWVVQGVTAAPRDWTPHMTDGTDILPLCTGTAVASGATELLWPSKEADNAKAVLPPFPISNEFYLELVDAMGAGETADVWVSYVHRSSEL